jgi:tyrosinase
MVTAANKLRMPYWDWAAKPPAGRQAFPQMFTDTTVKLNAPSGSITVANPLFSFSFKDSSGMLYSPFVNWKKSYRWPSNNGNNPTSQTSKMISAYANQRQGFQDQVYSLFTQCDDYLHWSNDQAGSSSTRCSTSIEAVHNNVHNVVGGPPGDISGGHMTYLPLGTFDPLFFLHHANVDRYFAMWQRTHSGSYVGSQRAPSTSWTIAKGSTQNIDSPLTPFYKNSNKQFWTARQVQDWTVFKYTYPEFANSDGSASSINRYINGLYGPNAGKTAGSSKRDLLDNVVSAVSGVTNNAAGKGSVSSSATSASASASSTANAVNNIIGNTAANIVGTAKDILAGNPLKANNGSVYQYVANMQAPRNALGGSYTVYLFNGEPTTDQSNYMLDSKLLGPMAVTSVSPNSPNAGMANDLIVSGTVPLTRSLQSAVSSSLLGNLAEALVGPFLTKNLVIKIVGPNGSDIDPKTLDGFSCEIAASTAQQSSDPAVLPTFSNFVKLLSIV